MGASEIRHKKVYFVARKADLSTLLQIRGNRVTKSLKLSRIMTYHEVWSMKRNCLCRHMGNVNQND